MKIFSQVSGAAVFSVSFAAVGNVGQGAAGAPVDSYTPPPPAPPPADAIPTVGELGGPGGTWVSIVFNKPMRVVGPLVGWSCSKGGLLNRACMFTATTAFVFNTILPTNPGTITVAAVNTGLEGTDGSKVAPGVYNIVFGGGG